MRLKEIEFILENCEVIKVDGRYIGEFLVEDIQTRILRIASNSIQKMEICRLFAVEIHPDGNKEYVPFGIEDMATTVFERLTKFNDITQIEFTLVDEDSFILESDPKQIEKCAYFLSWSNDEYSNRYQSSFISKNGALYLTAIHDKTAEQFFSEFLECDEAYDDSKFRWEMYNIGDKNFQEEQNSIRNALQNSTEGS